MGGRKNFDQTSFRFNGNVDYFVGRHNRELVAVANKINDLYVMKSNVYKDLENDIYVYSVKLTEKEKWHRALGHVNFQYLNKLVKDKLVDGLPDKLENNVMK